MSVGIPDDCKLDDDWQLVVRWIELTEGRWIEIEDAFHQTWLKPAHALVLLSWLERNRAELEELAKPKRKRRTS